MKNGFTLVEKYRHCEESACSTRQSKKLDCFAFARNDNRGFTLVELSIVLVIIGLLIGGILVGQSLIESAKINAQIQQFGQYDIAIRNFKGKFRQMPGDCGVCDHSMSSYPNVTVNGVLEDTNNTSPPVRFNGETYFPFVDMSTMGMLKEAYKWESGTWNAGTSHQFPISRISKNSGIGMTGTRFGDWFYWFMDTSNNQIFTDRLTTGFLSASQSLAIDSKLDDGSPTSGGVKSIRASVPGSTSTIPFSLETDNVANCIYNGIYNISLTASDLCRLVVKADVK